MVIVIGLCLMVFGSATALAAALHITVRPIFAWYDFWIGVFIDRKRQQLYFFPIPCFGFLIRWGARYG